MSLNETGIRPLIGNKDDEHDVSSVFGKLDILVEHGHKPARIWPDLATSVAMTAGASWALEKNTEIVPSGGITKDFDIHRVKLTNIESNGNYQINFFYGNTGAPTANFAGSTVFVKDAAQLSADDEYIQTPMIPANSRVTAKAATNLGTNKTIAVKILYHTY